MSSDVKNHPRLKVARWIERSEANGPGVRFVLWLQGCPLRCLGCWNPDTWDSAAGKWMTVDEVMQVMERVDGIEGLTVSGGEPFAQASSLKHLVSRAQSAGLSVLIFTGYEMCELGSREAQQVLAETDIVVTGRFVQRELDLSLRWRSSRNQRVHFLTLRYSSEMSQKGLAAEVIISSDGTTQLTGFPEEALIAEISSSTS
ncbi:MAG: 4Fe-4S single cluster domain-containing protein [Candidatus Brocadiia bacterium]